MARPSYITADVIAAAIERGLAEDLSTGDITTEATLDPHVKATAVFLAKADGVLAGLEVAQEVFRHLDSNLEIDWSASDGDAIASGTRFGTVRGLAHPILAGERLALNLMQRMSGIATATNRMVKKADQSTILDTRKTVPGLRLLDKWAVVLGGGSNHRIGLYDMILIKDNHIAAAGGVGEAISAANAYRTSKALDVQIEIEARTLEEVAEVVRLGGVERVLLDNMVVRQESGVDVSMLKRAVAAIDGKFLTEASGNVNLDTVAAIATTGVDFISSGALTHSVTALDISLKVTLGDATS